MKVSRALISGSFGLIGLSIVLLPGCASSNETQEPIASQTAATREVDSAFDGSATGETDEPAAEPLPIKPTAEPDGFTSPPVTRYVTSFALNVRSGPGKEFAIKRHVKQGDKLEVVINGEWAKLGTGEYVSINRLSKTPPPRAN